MSTTNFNTGMLEKINTLLSFVIKNQYSNFYKKKYSTTELTQVTSLEQFQQIPFLIKNDYAQIPLKDRIFFPLEEVTRYSFSSGTSQTKKITAIPQSYGPTMKMNSLANLEYGEELIKKGIAHKIIVLWPISASAFMRNITAKRDGIIVIAGDIRNMGTTAKIAKKTGAEGITTTATILEYFIPHLEEIGFDMTKITLIALGGEFCSTQKLEYFKNKFPSAFFSFKFGSSEVKSRGYRCKYLADNKSNIFHPTPHALIEIKKDNENDDFGEIIHTNLHPSPFPFIRYRTGDVGSLMEKTCECGEKYLLTVDGRGGMDLMKISGITLHRQMIENSFESISEYILPNFQAHIYEEKTGDRLKPKIEIHLELKQEHKKKKNDALFIEIATTKISHNLKLSKNATLNDLTEKGIFLPLSVIFVENLTNSHHKSKPIISHLV